MNTNVRNRLALTVGAAGVLAPIIAVAPTPPLGVNASSANVSARKNGPYALDNTNRTLVSIKVPAGKWLIFAPPAPPTPAAPMQVRPTGTSEPRCR